MAYDWSPDILSAVRHVTQLLALNDVALVEALYHTLLRRRPDRDGLEFYVGQLRSGCDRSLLIAEFALSLEARPALALPGLKGFITAQLRLRRRIWRRITRNWYRPGQLNRLENGVWQIQHELADLKLALRSYVGNADGGEARLRQTADAQAPVPATVTGATAEKLGPDDVDLAGVPLLAWRIYRELASAIESLDKPKTT